MLPIPRVNSFLSFDLKPALLCMNFIGIFFEFCVIMEYFLWTKSLESAAILLVLNLLPLLSATACIYGIIKNKPKLMLPEMIVGSFVIFMVIGIVILTPGIAVSCIEYTGRIDERVQFLRLTFFMWFIMCILTGAAVYYMIALYSLYMSLTEGGLNLARDTNFVLSMNQPATFA